MVTLRETIEELTSDGYVDDFFTVPSGLRAAGSGKIYAPGEMVTDRISRIDVDADPDGQVIVYALRAADGVRGTFVAAFGPTIDSADGEIVLQLDRS